MIVALSLVDEDAYGDRTWGGILTVYGRHLGLTRAGCR